MPPEEPHGKLVRHQASMVGMGEKLLSHFALFVQSAEDVPHGKVREVGHLAKHDALRSLTGTRTSGPPTLNSAQ